MVQPTTHPGYTVWPVAPGLQACTPCRYTNQHEMKSSARENDAIKRRGKREMHEAAVSGAWHTVLQQTFFNK